MRSCRTEFSYSSLFFAGFLILIALFGSGSALASSAARHIRQGETFYSLRLFQEALAEFNLAESADPGDYEVYLGRGKVYSELQRYPDAFADFNHALSLKKSCARLFYHRGRAWAALKDYPRAIADFDRALEIRHDLDHALFQRGLARYAAGDSSGGKKDILGASAMKNSEASVWLEMHASGK